MNQYRWRLLWTSFSTALVWVFFGPAVFTVALLLAAGSAGATVLDNERNAHV